MSKQFFAFLFIVTFALAGCQKEKGIQEAAPAKVASIDTLQLSGIKVCIDKHVPGKAGRIAHAAGLTSTKWPTGATIRVKFLNGDNFLKSKIQTYASIWMKYANINFVEVKGNARSDIRIGFKYDDDEGSWSYIGDDALQISQNEPTMNFGWFDRRTPELEFQRVILHEFGHALGLVHEQSSPAANIKWNKKAVYEYYEGAPNFWSKEDVDYNVFYKYSSTYTQYSFFDQSSIMQYPVDPQFTLDRKGIGLNTTLSNVDKAAIARAYPRN